MKCVDIFAGAGGLAEGLRQAGWGHALLVEKCEKACGTLRRNGFKNVRCAKVEEVDFKKYKGVDMLCGGPPCQPFSLGGVDGGEGDERNGWEEAVRAVRESECKSFMFENVSGMAREKFRPYVESLTRRLEGLGYAVKLFKVNAADYGVPQNRKRVLMIGFRDKRAAGRFVPPSLVKGKAATVGEAIESLGEPGPWREDGHVLHNVIARSYKGHTGSRIDAPSKTIVAGGGRGVPGGANTLQLGGGRVRYFTIREACRLQTFPDTFIFPETWSHAFNQLGNAVPPRLAKAWGERVMQALRPCRLGYKRVKEKQNGKQEIKTRAVNFTISSASEHG